MRRQKSGTNETLTITSKRLGEALAGMGYTGRGVYYVTHELIAEMRILHGEASGARAMRDFPNAKREGLRALENNVTERFERVIGMFTALNPKLPSSLIIPTYNEFSLNLAKRDNPGRSR